MKQITIIALAAIFLVSCGGGGTKKSADGTVTVSSRDAANEIIGYYNSSIGFFKDYKEPRKIDDIVKYMNELIEGKNRRRVMAPIIVDMSNMPSKQKDKNIVLAPGSCFDNDDRKILKDNFTTYVECIDKIYENFTTFKSYIQSEDYKDDDWAKAISLRDECVKCSETMAENKFVIYDVLSPLADAAEVLMLEGNPSRDHILIAKVIFDNMDTILEEYSAENVDDAQIEEMYSTLEKNVEKARALKPAEDKPEHKMKWYGKFLDNVDEFLGEVRKAKRESKYTESGFKRLQDKYRYSVNEYNSFVN